jgi:integrase
MQVSEMRRNDIQEQPFSQFPISIRKGHATVKVYRVKNRETTNFTVAYITAATGRKRRTFADLELAKREAHSIAAKLATDDLDALKLSGADRQMYVAAQQALGHVGIPLDSAVRDFARAFDILGGPNIVEAARYYKKHVDVDLPQVMVATAVTKFADAKRHEGMSANYLKDIKTILGRFADAFHVNLASITTEDLRDYLNGLRISPVAKDNHRRLIVVLFNFAKAHGWLRPNEGTAADALGAYKIKDRDVEIYTPWEVARLLAVADADFVPWIVLIAFAGVRREELAKGLTWASINFDRGTLIIPAAIAKTGRKRKIDLAENVLAWLAPYHGKHGSIFNQDPRKRMAKGSALSRVTWKKNSLRHSFGSYRMEQTKNAGQVALEMGNSAAVVMKHYFEIVDADDAREYWSIKPAPEHARKIVPMASHA